jgi:hypothetical protein
MVMAQAKMSVVAKTLTEPPLEPDRMRTSEPENHQEITVLAYQFWQERGCPIGSPEEDWFRAEQVLQSRE